MLFNNINGWRAHSMNLNSARAKLKVAPYSFLTARKLVSKSRDGVSFSKIYAKLARKVTQ